MDVDGMAPAQFAQHLRRLRAKRKKAVAKSREKAVRRSSLTPRQRDRILAKTAGRCHICGGKIEGKWQADHVLAHSAGGVHAEDNYLPAHPLCNNYRWHYTTEEFQLILKLGVMVRTMVEQGKPLGVEIAEAFVSKERQRARRTRATREGL
ncbi:MAG: HNH endonuclease [Gammaproteobacteria bacterium]